MVDFKMKSAWSNQMAMKFLDRNTSFANFLGRCMDLNKPLVNGFEKLTSF
jgi:hypothetical protein